MIDKRIHYIIVLDTETQQEEDLGQTNEINNENHLCAYFNRKLSFFVDFFIRSGINTKFYPH